MQAVVVLVIAAILLALGGNYNLPPSKGKAKKVFDKWFAILKPIAESWNINPILICAQVTVESSGDANARGSSGERGLGQLKEAALIDANAQAGTSYSFDEMFDPEKNLVAMCAYLTFCKIKMGNDIGLGLQAYNKGIGTVTNDVSQGREYRNLVVEYQNIIISFLTV